MLVQKNAAVYEQINDGEVEKEKEGKETGNRNTDLISLPLGGNYEILPTSTAGMTANINIYGRASDKHTITNIIVLFAQHLTKFIVVHRSRVVFISLLNQLFNINR